MRKINVEPKPRATEYKSPQVQAVNAMFEDDMETNTEPGHDQLDIPTELSLPKVDLDLEPIEYFTDLDREKHSRDWEAYCSQYSREMLDIMLRFGAMREAAIVVQERLNQDLLPGTMMTDTSFYTLTENITNVSMLRYMMQEIIGDDIDEVLFNHTYGVLLQKIGLTKSTEQLATVLSKHAKNMDTETNPYGTGAPKSPRAVSVPGKR